MWKLCDGIEWRFSKEKQNKIVQFNKNLQYDTNNVTSTPRITWHTHHPVDYVSLARELDAVYGRAPGSHDHPDLGRLDMQNVVILIHHVRIQDPRRVPIWARSGDEKEISNHITNQPKRRYSKHI